MGVHKQAPFEGELFNPVLAEKMADEARERPEVKRWVRRLGKLIKDMPDGLEVFVGDSICVLARGPKGEHFVTESGGAEQRASVESFIDGRWDGGGW